MINGLPLDAWILILIAVAPALLLQVVAWVGQRRRARRAERRP